MAKTKANNSYIHERIVIGILLSLVGGVMDAYSYIIRGGVFANAQTGNIVLLFISFGEKHYNDILKYLTPVLMFALGIFISEILKNIKNLSPHLRIKLVLVFEFLIISAVGIFGNLFSDFIVNSVISFIAALQVSNFDKVNGNPMATTMITGNLKSSIINLEMFIRTKDRIFLVNFNNYIVIILSFGIGVLVGSIATIYLGVYSILICLLFLILSYIVVLFYELRYSK